MARRFVIACGGTGGHSFPGMAVADELVSRGHGVTLWTSGRMIESSVFREWKGGAFTTGARPLSVKHALANALSLWRCRRELGRERPDALLAMGSYASLPPVLAAASRRVPVVLHEANAVPGRATDYLAPFARAVATTFPETEGLKGAKRVVCTGLPVRANLAEAARFDDVPANAFTVFVTGGSQGAHRVNELASEALVLLSHAFAKDPALPPLGIIHQTGFADEGRVISIYASAGLKARVNAFEREMGRAFATADVVIARAGASTCFELASLGKPAFFIPLPSALRNHQHANAFAFVKRQAADEGIQDELTPRALANYLLRKAADRASLRAMGEKMKAMSQPRAAANLADLLEEVSGSASA